MLRRLPVLAALLVGCARAVVPPTPPGPATASRPALPPVPAVDGPLAIRVVYPRPDQVVTSRNSNFIFGSIGSGRATLRIDGQLARVYPNGAFIAFVPNPPGSSPSEGARACAPPCRSRIPRRVTRRRRVPSRRPPPPPPPPSPRRWQRRAP